MSKRAQKKRDRSRRTASHSKRTGFAEYVDGDRSLDLPPSNASEEVLVEYIQRVDSLIQGHEDEVGSGLLAWRLGKVLTWMKERCDNGQLDLGEGKKSTYIPPEYRTEDGEPPVIMVHSIDEMENLAKQKMKEHGLNGIGSKDEVPGPPRFLLTVENPTGMSVEQMKNMTFIAEIRVDPTVMPNKSLQTPPKPKPKPEPMNFEKLGGEDDPVKGSGKMIENAGESMED